MAYTNNFQKSCPECYRQKREIRDFHGGPVVKNSPSNSGDAGSIRGWGTRSHMQ